MLVAQLKGDLLHWFFSVAVCIDSVSKVCTEDEEDEDNMRKVQ